MSESVCKGCGKKIIWGKTKEGKNIPLDKSAPIYRFNSGDGSAYMCDPEAQFRNYYVSHFSTCSKANDFSASKKS